ncbi:hypothetical protein BDB13_3480 [Rhodococcus sp. OK302]|nr:hypothetical protein BDB13_3480 [Rhodococcus sp. OK302]
MITIAAELALRTPAVTAGAGELFIAAWAQRREP